MLNIYDSIVGCCGNVPPNFLPKATETTTKKVAYSKYLLRSQKKY